MQFLKLYKKYASKEYSPLLPTEIKEIRQSYNLSQMAFARLLEINLNTLQNYEIGRTHTPSPAVALFLLAKDHPEVFMEKRLIKFHRKPRGFTR